MIHVVPLGSSFIKYEATMKLLKMRAGRKSSSRIHTIFFPLHKAFCLGNWQYLAKTTDAESHMRHGSIVFPSVTENIEKWIGLAKATWENEAALKTELLLLPSIQPSSPCLLWIFTIKWLNCLRVTFFPNRLGHWNRLMKNLNFGVKFKSRKQCLCSLRIKAEKAH